MTGTMLAAMPAYNDIKECNPLYKIGDQVIVTDIQDGIDEMKYLLGETCTILRVFVDKTQHDDNFYELKEDNLHFYWHEEWLSPASEIQMTESEYDNIWS